MRIGLRGLLVMVALLAVCFAVAGNFYRREQAMRRAYIDVALQQHVAMRAKLQSLLPGDTPQKAAQLRTEIAELDSKISSLKSEFDTFRKK